MCDNEVKFCTNCKREVPIGNFMMHHVHCQRKLALCQKCDEPIPHSELQTHNLNYHAVVSCPDCGSQMEKQHLNDHQSSSCSHRAVCCNFCHIETEANELAEHENYCGSRTERCNECGEFVMLKYQQLHEDSNHGFLKLEDEPGPTPSWNVPRNTSVLNDLSRQRKVSNASQDATRPTSASNRLSPSKRTNDMPQVNSSANVSKPKAVDKPTIPQGNASDEDTVDIDRLLALRLAEQDRSFFSMPSAPPDVDYNTSADLVALPCEFCEAMIPANQLVIHETGCRPDLSKVTPPVSKPRNRPEPQEEGLPCEFCDALFPPRLLLQHEAACDVISPIQDSILVNELGPTRRKSHHGPKKTINQDLSSPRLFLPRRQPSPTDGYDSDDRNPYLMEVRAALKKPTANVLPVGRNISGVTSDITVHNTFSATSNHHLPSTCVNGFSRRNGSTGAVPKQKAGKRVGIREVPQEVSRSSPSNTAVASSARHHNAGSNDSSRHFCGVCKWTDARTFVL
ncbi:XIAP-associated factor 1 [Anabrus simplex]|uniref:XIAP-associated factor 1 n=1 Tax=Anabrus simplex TaxID=316456 RepID=UPI0034DDB6FA